MSNATLVFYTTQVASLRHGSNTIALVGATWCGNRTVDLETSNGADTAQIRLDRLAGFSEAQLYQAGTWDLAYMLESDPFVWTTIGHAFCPLDTTKKRAIAKFVFPGKLLPVKQALQLRVSFTSDAIIQHDVTGSTGRGHELRRSAIGSSKLFSCNDVALLFPDEAGDMPVLWANKQAMEIASPKWKIQLNGDFSESHSRLVRLGKWPQLARDDLSALLADERSDPAGNEPQSKRLKLSSSVVQSDNGNETSHTPGMNGAGSDIRCIIIKDSPIAAYEVVLDWLKTGSAAFSRCVGTTVSNVTGPDAIYALSHYLEIEDLQKQSLSEYYCQLTQDNALSALLGDRAYIHPELKKVALGSVKRHWDQVKAAGGPDLLKVMIDGEEDKGKREYLTGVMVDLLSNMR